MASRFGPPSHLRESLLQIFPALKAQLPTDPDVLKFQEIKQPWVTQLRGADPRTSRAQENPVVNELGKQLGDLEYKWAPPPHLRKDMDYSPIPESFFKQAAGDAGAWDLRRVHNKDLVPVEQLDLIQDMPSIPALQHM